MCVHVCFMFAKRVVLRVDLTKGLYLYVYEKSLSVFVLPVF